MKKIKDVLISDYEAWSKIILKNWLIEGKLRMENYNVKICTKIEKKRLYKEKSNYQIQCKINFIWFNQRVDYHYYFSGTIWPIIFLAFVSGNVSDEDDFTISILKTEISSNCLFIHISELNVLKFQNRIAPSTDEI